MCGRDVRSLQNRSKLFLYAVVSVVLWCGEKLSSRAHFMTTTTATLAALHQHDASVPHNVPKYVFFSDVCIHIEYISFPRNVCRNVIVAHPHIRSVRATEKWQNEKLFTHSVGHRYSLMRCALHVWLPGAISSNLYRYNSAQYHTLTYTHTWHTATHTRR